MAGFSAGGFPVKTDAFLQLLEKFDEGKGGDDDGNEIEERVGDDEVNDERVRLSHPFQMDVTPKVVDGTMVQKNHSSVFLFTRTVLLTQSLAPHCWLYSRTLRSFHIRKGIRSSIFTDRTVRIKI